MVQAFFKKDLLEGERKMDQKYIERTNELYKTVDQTQSELIQLWLDSVVFTPLWWLSVALSIIPWIVWFFFHNKSSRNRMMFVGLAVMLVSSFLDFCGVQLGLWVYYYELVPWVPAYEPYDWSLLPVVIMMLIEYKPNASPYLKGIIFGAFTAFVGEPLFQYVGLYRDIHWSPFYSFPIYFLIFLFSYWLSRRSYFEKYWL